MLCLEKKYVWLGLKKSQVWLVRLGKKLGLHVRLDLKKKLGWVRLDLKKNSFSFVKKKLGWVRFNKKVRLGQVRFEKKVRSNYDRFGRKVRLGPV